MQLAEPGDDVGRPELDAAAAARMRPGRRLGDELQLVDIVAERIERRREIGLGVEHA